MENPVQDEISDDDTDAHNDDSTLKNVSNKIKKTFPVDFYTELKILLYSSIPLVKISCFN
jgi:hypothetical protein